MRLELARCNLVRVKGEIKAHEESNLHFKVSGRVTWLCLKMDHQRSMVPFRIQSLISRPMSVAELENKTAPFDFVHVLSVSELIWRDYHSL